MTSTETPSRPIQQISKLDAELNQHLGELQQPTLLPLTDRVRSDLRMLKDGIEEFHRRFKREQDVLRTSTDADKVRRIRHDLRNALSLVVGFAALLLREIPPPFTPPQRTALTDLEACARELLALVTSIE